MESELLERREPSLRDERLSDDGGDDSLDDFGEDPLLSESEDFDELDLLPMPLEETADGCERELRELDDLLSDEPDGLDDSLLPDWLGELFELSDERLERERPLDDWLGLEECRLLESELRRLLLGPLFDELCTELDPLLSDESLDRLDDERDDSLTLENDLLDP